ncbi:MAG: ATP-dependent helicase [Ferruginibacter sp.]|nr:ATP-dependent helicase [Ferruginibacter sp.]
MKAHPQRLEEKFKETYNQLNKNQQLAVDSIEGPVMVIAGPGTGKTQILAARIGKILLETDALPENILCLTYTDAGAVAMRRRLQQFIGADAYKVNIYTFHAFCNDVIQDNLNLFEKNALEAISELEAIQLFKTLIDQLPKNHPLKRYRGNVYYEIPHLRSLFSTMKREGWTPEYITGKIKEYIDSLPDRPEFRYQKKYKQFNAGDLKEGKVKEEIQRAERLGAAVMEFDRFQEMMRQKNRYDFDDMINWVIRVFEQHPQVLANYQEKFQHILVDEFQDTSGTQNRIVELLIHYWDNPNVFVVGDDDQSIFRFQGANIENMLLFAHRYADNLKTIVLTNNYRSTQPILDISKTLIDKNTERLVTQIGGLSKDLQSSNIRIQHLQHPPEIFVCNSAKEEMIWITQQIAARIASGTLPEKIAVIYKENKYGEELSRYFRLKQIPFYSKRSINILEHPFIHKIITLLSYLNAEHDVPYGGDEMLFEILHFDFYQIPPIEIAKVTVEANSRKYSGEAASIRKLIAEKQEEPPKDLFDAGLYPQLGSVSKMLESLIADVPNLTLQQLFEKMMRQAGVLSYIMKSNDKIELMQLLTALFDFIKEENTRNPFLNLDELMSMIALMKSEGLPIPLVQVTGSDKAVNLLTAHGSKGLEFEHVFFAGLNAVFWEKKNKSDRGYKLPDTMFSAASGSTSEEELRRLFYVALTRAEVQLHLSYANYRNDGKLLEPTMFLAEILEKHALPTQTVTLSDEEILEYNHLQFSELAPEIEKTEEAFVSQILSKFVMNVTALNAYLKCPLGFYYRNLLRIPSGKNENTEFGSAVHYAVEKLFTKMKAHPGEQFPSSDEMIGDFEWYMRKHRENFTKEAFNRRMEYGHDVLKNYYDKYIHTWNKVVAVERNIRHVVVNDVPLKGKLDKLEFNGKEVNVVDYKTGNIEKALPKLKSPDAKNPEGGDYWRQAVFYKILVDYHQHDWKVVSTEFDFIEPDKNGNYRKEKIVISPADMETVKHQIKEVWDKIQQRDFYTGCGKKDCHWCNFVKDNQLAVELHQLMEEDEET